jgi:hypothetical protein
MTVTTDDGDAVACVRQVYKEIAAALAQKNVGATVVEPGEGPLFR